MVVEVDKENFTWAMESLYLVLMREIMVLLVVVEQGSTNGMVVEEEVLLIKVVLLLVDKVLVRMVEQELQ